MLENSLTELKIAESLNDSNTILRAHKDLSFIYGLLGNYKKALTEAKLITERTKTTGNKQEIAFSLWDQARAYYSLCKEALKNQDSNSANSNYIKAIECDIKALKLVSEIKDSVDMGFYHSDLGIIYDKCNLVTDASLLNKINLIKANYYSQALESNSNALNIYKALNDSNGMMDPYTNFGLFYRNQGNLLIESGKSSLGTTNYKKSLDYYLKVLAILKKLGYKHGIANYSKEVGVAYLKLGELAKAQKYIHTGAVGFGEIGFKDGAKECYEKLSEIDYKKGDYKNAFEDYKKFSALKDSITNETKSKQLIEIEIKYETQKKSDSLAHQQNLISFQKRSIAKRNYFLIGLAILVLIATILFIFSLRQSKKISKQYKEIQQLQSELTHRTTNFFGSIKGMLSAALATSFDKETISSLDSRINTINRLYKTLYSSPANKHLAFSELLASICNDFEYSFGQEKGIHVSATVNASVSKEEAVPLAFIITELLTNSYKYAFDGIKNPEIHVELNEKGETRTLHVWDNGNGVTENSVKKEYTQGMSIIKSYCRTLEGKMSTWNDNGFHFQMEF
jgi:two-component sensor histidine kinase